MLISVIICFSSLYFPIFNSRSQYFPATYSALYNRDLIILNLTHYLLDFLYVIFLFDKDCFIIDNWSITSKLKELQTTDFTPSYFIDIKLIDAAGHMFWIIDLSSVLNEHLLRMVSQNLFMTRVIGEFTKKHYNCQQGSMM